jgi:hypothetical protein
MAGDLIYVAGPVKATFGPEVLSEVWARAAVTD